MQEAAVVLLVILILGAVIWLIVLPSKLVSTKTPNTMNWTIATLATGIIPGVIAALLYRYKDVSPGKAFGIGVVSYIAFVWLVVGIFWLLGFDVPV